MHTVRHDGAYCADSTGPLDWSQHDPAVLQANVDLREAWAEDDVVIHPTTCGWCRDCEQWFRQERGRLEQEARPGPLTAEIEGLLRHARRFGSELVYETARDTMRLSYESLARLRIELDEIERDCRNGSRGRQRMATAARLEAGGVPKSKIAKKVNATEAEVDDLIRAGRTAPTRRSRRQRTEAALALHADGLTTLEIGLKLGVSGEHVQRLLRESNPGYGLAVSGRQNPCISGGQNGGFRPSSNGAEALPGQITIEEALAG